MPVTIRLDLNNAGWTGTWTRQSLSDALLLVQSYVLLNAGSTSSWRIELDSDLTETYTSVDLGSNSTTLVTVLPAKPATRAKIDASGISRWLDLRGDGATFEFVRIDFELTCSLAVPTCDLIHVHAQTRLRLDSCSMRRADSLASRHRGVVVERPGQADGLVPGVELTLDNVLIEGFDVGVRMVGGRSFVATDSAVVGAQDGVVLALVSEVRIQNCVLRDCGTGLLQLADYAASGTELVTSTPEREAGGLTLDSTVEDCQFTDCRRGVDLWHDGGSLHGKRYAYLRCEFSAPALTSGDRIGLRVRFRPGQEGGDPAQPSCVQVASSVFHHLVAGVEVLSTRTGRIWIDHNTFDLPEPGFNVRPREREEFFGQPLENWSMGVAVRGSELPDWENQLPDAPGGYPLSRPPLLLITDNVFQTGTRTRTRVHPVMFGGAWSPVGLQGSPLTPQNHAYPVLLAHNLLSSAWLPLSDFAVAPDLSVGVFSMDAFQLGQPFTGPWANQLGDARLARPPGVEPQATSWDFHPVQSLDSDAVALGSLPPYERGLVFLWGYRAPARHGFYGNQPVVPGVPDPPREAIGGAEPVGWAEFPVYAQNLGADEAAGTTTLDQARADVYDVVTFPESLVGAPTSSDTTTLSGDPIADAAYLFQLSRLRLLADAALQLGLKVTGPLPILGTGFVRVPDATGTLVVYEVPAAYSELDSAPATSDLFLDYWRQAALAQVEAIRTDPVLAHVVAWWFMPQEIRVNAFGATNPGSGGAVWEYPACLRLRADIDALGPPFKRTLSFQPESGSSFGASLPGELAGAASFIAGTAARRNAGELTFDPLTALDLWTERFNQGQLAPGLPVSVGRPDPDAPGGTPLNTAVPPEDMGRAQVEYRNATQTTGPNAYPPVELTPPLDPLGFRAIHLDGVFPGNYLDRDLFDQRRFGPLATVNGWAPEVLENRILIYHRLRSLLEARVNARYLLGPYSQALHDGSVHHMIEIFRDNFQDENGVPSASYGRLWPETPALAAHDLLIGLAEADGVGIYNDAYAGLLPASPVNGGVWQGMSGTNLGVGAGDPHPGWAGYEEVLRLLKGTLPSGHPGFGTILREFLVAGERDFDLGFEVMSPVAIGDRILPGRDYGQRSGWVGIADYPRLGHWVLRIRNQAILLVTHSAVDRPTTFRFCNAARFPNATAVQLLVAYAGAGSATVAPLVGASHLFQETLTGIDARVYRIELD